MSKILIFLFFFISLTAKGQAHLGISEYAIKNLYPENVWKTDYADDGTKYISTDMYFGNYVYYFDKATKVSYSCLQIPFNSVKLNGQVEAYNNKYVITSESSWTAYLDEGGIMYIKLIYSEKNHISYFTYSNYK